MNEKLIIDWMEKKNNDWIVMNLSKADGVKLTDVSINRTNKKGEVFPAFDDIVNGGSIEGNLWQSSVGKWYLFAPKADSGKRPNMDRVMEKKAGMVAEAQDRKTQGIEKAQDRSAWMWAKTNACTIIASDTYMEKNLSIDDLVDRIEKLATDIYNLEPSKPF